MTVADALPVRPLFTLTGTIGTPPPAIITGPQGLRTIIGVTDGTFEGQRLTGTVAANVGGDFASIRPDGSLRLDVRLVLVTHDNAAIYMTYNGVGVPDGAGGFSLKTAPTFETGAEEYGWLNTVQAISLGASTPTSLRYDVYELL